VLNFDPRQNDTDPEKDPLTITSVDGQPIVPGSSVTLTNGFGVVTMKTDGSLSFTPKDNYNGDFSVPYTITDGEFTSSSTLDFTITSVNDAPDAVDNPYTVAEGGLLTGNLITDDANGPAAGGVDSDVDNDTLSITAINGTPVTFVAGEATVAVANGSLLIKTDGSFTYTHNGSEPAPTSFTYTITDGKGEVDTATATLTVTPVNDTPVITGNLTGTTTEDTVLTSTGKLNIVDPDPGESVFEAQSGTDGTYGAFSITTDGSWTYALRNDAANVQALANGEVKQERFTVTTADGTQREIVIQVNGLNDAPVLLPASGTVSEEGLPGGLPDTSGVPGDTTDLTTVSGTLQASDIDTGTTLQAFNVTAPVDAVSSGGTPVTWSSVVVGDVQTLTGTAGGTTVGTLTVNQTTGAYTFTLSGPIDHPVADVEDTLPINFGVSVSDGIATTGSTLTINVEDDKPSAAASQTEVTVVTDANVMIVLDQSSSMNKLDGLNGESRWVTAIDAIKVLLSKYDDIGDVRVRLVTFNDTTSTQAQGAGWLTVAEANSILDGLRATTVPLSKGTNYDAALATAETAFATAGKLDTGVNVSYFISDGVPTYGSGTTTSLTGIENGDGAETTAPTADEGIQAAEQANWQSFLTTNEINSFALGIGGTFATPPAGYAAPITYLNPIAYDGSTASEKDGIVVTDFAQLDNELGATVPVPISGSLLDASVFAGGGAGADGPAFVKSITINGITYSYDPESGAGNVSGGASSGTFDATTATWTVTTRQADGSVGGKFIVDMNDGTYSYTVPPTVAIRNISEVLNFVVSDQDGDTASAALTVNVTNPGAPKDNAAPVVDAQTQSVSEEGLVGGIADSTGTSDTTNASTVSGTMVANDPDTDPELNQIGNWTLGAPTTSVTVGGVPVEWAGNGTQALTGSVNGQSVATLTINNAGQYTFTLLKGIDHSGINTEDVKALDFSVSATDGRATGTNILTINVEDDSPSVAVAQTRAATTLDTNIMVVLDTSGSMSTTDGVNGQTRLASAIASVNALLDRYDNLGETRVRLVTFSTNAQAQGDVWTTVSQARTLLATLGSTTPTGGTNYDEALADAISAFSGAGKLANAQNVSYFISDGAPTFGSGTTDSLVAAGQSPGTPATNGSGNSQTGSTDTGIQAAEEAQWKDFLLANNVDSFALGVGGVTAAQRVFLDPIAYDGRAGQDRNGLVVSAFSQLDNVLASTVPEPVSGNLLSGGFLTSGVGGDGGAFVRSIEVNGVTYTFNPAAGGSISGLGAAATFDDASNVLTVTTSLGGKFIVDMDDGSYSYQVPPSVNSAGAVESLNFVVSDRDGDTTGSSLTVNVTNANFVNGSSAAETLNGTALTDIITGREGNDVINGLGGDDRLFGGAGNDTINGGDGNDLINGGIGSDILTGGAGSDVFQWRLADPAATNAAKAIDTITDFNSAPVNAGGDVLDLRDLLTGESTATIANFVDISVAGGNTTIKISPTGGFTGGTVNNTETHDIVLQGVDIRAGLGLAGSATEAEIINKMITDGKLLVDN